MEHTVAMQRAIALAEKGLGKTAPNPIVGAVIIDSTGNVVGEGFHDRVNSPDHAEVVAIKAAGDKSKRCNDCCFTGALQPYGQHWCLCPGNH
jgi:diaminohydroxyphosphoribosylaminopyrimidine deaminase/5-amino-6-(5-phosphoribosylamino)uracil reductase